MVKKIFGVYIKRAILVKWHKELFDEQKTKLKFFQPFDESAVELLENLDAKPTK